MIRCPRIKPQHRPRRLVMAATLLMGLGLITPAPAAAAPTPTQAASAWQLREVRSAAGALDYCIIEQNAGQGHLLNIARDAAGTMNLGLIIPAQRWRVGQSVPLRLRLDAQTSRAYTARAQAATMLLLDVPAPLATELRQARAVRVELDTPPVRLMLADFAGALATLTACATAPAAATPATSIPSVPSLPPALLTPLEQAGLADAISFMPPPAGISFVDYAWQRAGLIGGVKNFTAMPNFRAAVRGELALLKTACQGLWSDDVGLILVSGTTQTQRATLSCALAGREEMMGVVFHADSQNGGNGRADAHYYVHAGQGQDRAAIEAATTALTTALTRRVP
jgi:hypothetical protein